jgi:hypothetical protein
MSRKSDDSEDKSSSQLYDDAANTKRIVDWMTTLFENVMVKIVSMGKNPSDLV